MTDIKAPLWCFIDHKNLKYFSNVIYFWRDWWAGAPARRGLSDILKKKKGDFSPLLKPPSRLLNTQTWYKARELQSVRREAIKLRWISDARHIGAIYSLQCWTRRIPQCCLQMRSQENDWAPWWFLLWLQKYQKRYFDIFLTLFARVCVLASHHRRGRSEFPSLRMQSTLQRRLQRRLEMQV